MSAMTPLRPLSHPAITVEPDTSVEPLLLTHRNVSDEAHRLRFRHPVFVADSVWADCVHWDEEIEAEKYGDSGEEPEGRLRDLLCHARHAASASRSRSTVFLMPRIPPTGRGLATLPAYLRMSIVPDARLAPVIVIEHMEVTP